MAAADYESAIEFAEMEGTVTDNFDMSIDIDITAAPSRVTSSEIARALMKPAGVSLTVTLS